MVGENGYPETPDWLPESRCDCPEARIDHFAGQWRELRPRVTQPLNEALRLWDRDWATWAGDQA